ncbi:MAG TPA: hypothetical protein VJ765_05310, partial [Chitinophagaceae bacterium]|nr:hypothetical protein [Chitinophagaceae bacterium]
MKKSIPLYLTIIILLFSSFRVSSQLISSADKKTLRIKEDSLQQIARFMILDTLEVGRFLAYKDFVPTLIRALKVKNSFYYPFDSVLGISKLYAPDSSFRIITWYMEVDDYRGYQKGLIQHNTKDGSLKLNSLFDNSEWSDNTYYKICRDTNWIGAVYYNIIKTQHQGKNYYTLFGIDREGLRSQKKWIEVLSFDENKRPVFGGAFNFKDDSVAKRTQSRFSIEYKKDSRTFVNYEPELKMILVDHLISETDEPEFTWTYVPDGDYEGFKWQNGQWVHIDKVFNFKLEDGQAPVGDPLMDYKGNKNEEKLKQKSDSN